MSFVFLYFDHRFLTWSHWITDVDWCWLMTTDVVTLQYIVKPGHRTMFGLQPSGTPRTSTSQKLDDTQETRFRVCSFYGRSNEGRNLKLWVHALPKIIYTVYIETNTVVWKKCLLVFLHVCHTQEPRNIKPIETVVKDNTSKRKMHFVN